jgi:HEAT repeat protein
VTPVGPGLVAGTAVTGLVVLLLVAVAAAHVSRTHRQARDAQRRAALTPLVLALLDGDDDEDGGASRAGLTAAPALLDEVVLGLLPQLRGGDRELLQQVLTARGVVDRAAADLGARAAWRRGRAATLLGSTGSRAHTAALTALLSDRDPEVRCAAARALGKSGDPSALTSLLAALSAEPPLPAGVVGMAVLDLGTPALPALRSALDTGAPAAQTLAAELLGLHGDLPASPALELLVRGHDRPVPVRRAAAGALGRIGSPAATDVLVRALGSPELTATAAQALGRIGDPFALPALVAGLAATEPEARAACANALAALGPDGRDALTSAAAGRHAAGAAAQAARAALDALAASPRRQLAGLR